MLPVLARRCVIAAPWHPFHARHNGQRQLFAAESLSLPAAPPGLRRWYAKPYTPRTNGKAGRFIQTRLRE